MTRAERDALRRDGLECLTLKEFAAILSALDAADEALERAEAALEAADWMARSLAKGRYSDAEAFADDYRAARAKAKGTT